VTKSLSTRNGTALAISAKRELAEGISTGCQRHDDCMPIAAKSPSSVVTFRTLMHSIQSWSARDCGDGRCCYLLLMVGIRGYKPAKAHSHAGPGNLGCLRRWLPRSDHN
jgi:hypothetical protein